MPDLNESDSEVKAADAPANKPTEPTPKESSVEAPPPPPKSIFNIIYEAGDENAPKEHITATIQGFIDEYGLETEYDIFFVR